MNLSAAVGIWLSPWFSKGFISISIMQTQKFSSMSSNKWTRYDFSWPIQNMVWIVWSVEQKWKQLETTNDIIFKTYMSYMMCRNRGLLKNAWLKPKNDNYLIIHLWAIRNPVDVLAKTNLQPAILFPKHIRHMDVDKQSINLKMSA